MEKMTIKGLEIEDQIIKADIKRIINLIYKLLPMREEGGDWIKPLETIIIELIGLYNLSIGQKDKLFIIICKLQGMASLIEKEDFDAFRRTIFECINLLTKVEEDLCQH